MVIAKQIEIRNNIKKFFDVAYEGDTVLVPRKENRNVVIISEKEYARLNQANRIETYASALSETSLNLPGANADSVISSSVKDDNHRKLKEISELKDDWNRNGAPAFSGKLIGKVRSILGKLSIQPELFPTALGTIQLEYDNSRRDHMEIEIGESSEAEVFVYTYNKKEYFENIPATAGAINKKVMEFYG